MKYSVGKPIHQSIGNFTARLLLDTSDRKLEHLGQDAAERNVTPISVLGPTTLTTVVIYPVVAADSRLSTAHVQLPHYYWGTPYKQGLETKQVCISGTSRGPNK